MKEPILEEAPACSRRERRKEQTYRRLLEAAERLFRTQSFDATTVETIAAEADVAKGTFFNYFESKESVLGEIIYTRTRPLFESPPGEGLPATERIALLLMALWRELEPYKHIARRVASHMMAKSPPPPPPIATQHFYLHSMTHLIQVGQAQGLFRTEYDAELLGVLLITYVFRLFVIACERDDVGEQWEEHLRQNLDLLYHGIMKPAP